MATVVELAMETSQKGGEKERMQNGTHTETRFGFRSTWGNKRRIDADLAAAELERIRAEEGILNAEVVVNYAEQEDNPLHEIFEWDDNRAAHAHRLEQARKLIRSVVVITPDQPAQTVYVHVRGQTEGQYLPLSVVVAQPDLYREALDEARDHLNYARARVDELLAVAPEPRSKHITRAASSIATAAKELEREKVRHNVEDVTEPVGAVA